MASFKPRSTDGMCFNSACGYQLCLREFERTARRDHLGKTRVLKVRTRDWKLVDDQLFDNVEDALAYVDRQPLVRGWSFEYQLHNEDAKYAYHGLDGKRIWDADGNRIPFETRNAA